MLLITVIFCVLISHGTSNQGTNNMTIIGGHKVPISNVPFMAGLVGTSNGTRYICGASIIKEQFVMTAAHCCLKDASLKIHVGTDRLITGGKTYDVAKTIRHELYNESNKNYDICIIKLKEKLQFGPTVNNIVLANSNLKLDVGTILNALGWGLTQEDGHIASNNLLEVRVPLVSRKKCIQKFGYTRITNNMMCAGAKNKDTCKGDSGGPLTVMNVIQVGITSFGGKCGEMGVYTRVAAVLPWINNIIDMYS